MSRGKGYKLEDDQKLLELYRDNEKKKYIDIAKMAQRYGICTERDQEELSEHISRLVSQKDDDEDTDDIDLDLMSALKEVNDTRNRYEGLLHVILETATLSDFGLLFLDFKAILQWMYRNEPERVSARIEALTMRINEK